jgi:hypothetical protein
VVTQGVLNPNPSISSAARRFIADSCRTQHEVTRLKNELSQYLEISPVTLNAKLRADRTWDVDEVLRLALFFDKEIAELFGGEPDSFISRRSRSVPSEQAGRQGDQFPILQDVQFVTVPTCEVAARHPIAA